MTLLGAGLMPDDATLATAGIPKSAAEALYQKTVKPTTGTTEKTIPDPDPEPVPKKYDSREFGSLQSKIATMIAQHNEQGAMDLFAQNASRMTDEQQRILIEMIDKYFQGG
jgi:hypothetical protein